MVFQVILVKKFESSGGPPSAPGPQYIIHSGGSDVQR